MNALESHTVHLLEQWGITHPIFSVNLGTITATWIVLVLLLISSLLLRIILKRKNGTYEVISSFIESFVGATEQSLGDAFKIKHVMFLLALFIFILYCNLVAILPFVEEPTKDLNTALALGVTGFIYKDVFAIAHHGIRNFLKEFIQPFFLLFPINFVSHFVKIVSVSVRLFGNIFAGSIISQICLRAVSSSPIFEILGIISGINLLVSIVFILVEGIVHAAVFTMVNMMYLGLALKTEPTDQPELPL
jgi:F-type H+-transporting ATPase subunit a